MIGVVGTDTDVGKTVVTAALLRALARQGMRPRGVKAVQTGAPGTMDADRYRQAVADASTLTPEAFTPPCSPHRAAVLAGRRLDAAALVARLREAADAPGADYTVVEGSGGWLVPLNETETLADVMAGLGAPMVLVAANRLGALNHALLTLESIRARGLDVAALVVNQPAPPADEAIARDNRAFLRGRAGVEVVDLPFCPTFDDDAWDRLAECLDSLARRLARPDPPTPPSPMSDTLAYDRAHVWHPYAGIDTDAPVWEAVRTGGSHIQLADGRRLLDGMASWWAAIHGYNPPAIMEALRCQAARMPHVMFGGLTHAPAVDLTRKLLTLAPDHLQQVFFADSGSVAVEVALKMAVQCQVARGCPERRRILAPRGGYHGDTLGAMSVGDPATGRHGRFGGLLPEHVFVDRPSCRFDAPFDDRSLDGWRDVFARRGHELAAAIIEPIVQGAGGMWFYHPDALRGLATLCREHGVLLILDEIATGFGRTGRMFAAEWAGDALRPDILCVGKALTGGVMTLAATLCTPEVARVISADGGVLMHGPTFMANPLACAAAHASLDLLTASPWRERVGRIEARLRAGLVEPLRGAAGVADVRVLGAIGVVEMESTVDVGRLQRFFVDERGVWLRPFGRLIYLMPPYILRGDEVDRLTAAIRAVVEGGVWAG